MNGIVDILGFCLLTGFIGLSVLLIAAAVLRWVSPGKTRTRRLNLLAAGAALTLGLMLAFLYWDKITDVFSANTENATLLKVLFSASTLTVKLLLLAIATASILMLVLLIGVFLKYGLDAVFSHKAPNTPSPNVDIQKLKNVLNLISDRLLAIMKSRIVTAVIAWGLLAMFFFLPFLAGEAAGGNLGETWVNGVYEIVSFGDAAENGTNTDDPGESPSNTAQSSTPEPSAHKDSAQSFALHSREPFFNALIKYILLSVIVLGVVFAVFRLICSIISQALSENKKANLLDEYSGAIGVLSVGVAMLWTLQNDKDLSLLADPSRLFLEFLKSFGIVLVIVALIILTLEIIRLLLDMRQKLVRQEAKLLFITVIGQVSLLLLDMLSSIYEAVDSAIGNSSNMHMRDILEKIRTLIIEAMDAQLKSEKEHTRAYSSFDETVTQADEPEEES